MECLGPVALPLLPDPTMDQEEAEVQEEEEEGPDQEEEDPPLPGREGDMLQDLVAPHSRGRDRGQAHPLARLAQPLDPAISSAESIAESDLLPWQGNLKGEGVLPKRGVFCCLGRGMEGRGCFKK
jgi:hypothetical protein